MCPVAGESRSFQCLGGHLLCSGSVSVWGDLLVLFVVCPRCEASWALFSLSTPAPRAIAVYPLSSSPSLGFSPTFRAVMGDWSVLSSRFHLALCGVRVKTEEVRQKRFL